MKMTKLYTTVFDEEMKSRGFKKKAKLYYRLNGDNLQGVVINSCNPYMLDFYSAPYWMENVQAYLAPLYRGDWATHGGFEINSSRYYQEEEEQINLDRMNFCLMLAKEHILPFMDEIYDLNSYIDHLEPRWKGLGRETASGILEICPGEFDKKMDIPFSTMSMQWALWMRYTYSAFLEYGCIRGDLQKGYDYMLEKGSFIPESWQWVEFSQKYYDKFMTEDGLERAKQYLEERRQIMLPRLRDELGLSVFNL